MVLIMALGAMAQNANRSGFFAEFGAGGFTGKTPRTSVTRTLDDKFEYTIAKGCALDLSLGYRLRFSNHWAYEWRFGLEASAKEFNALFNPKIFPVGFRYTSSEFFRNNSFYVHVNLGISSCPNGVIEDIRYTTWRQGLHKTLGSSFGFVLDCAMGFVYSFGCGVNLTNNLYAGIVYDAQILACVGGGDNRIYHHGGSRNIYWGTPGVRFGYRF